MAIGGTAQYDWISKQSKGAYMAGTIQSDIRGNACACGGKFQQVKEFDFSVPRCDSCNQFPQKFRIKRYLPGLNEKRGKHIIIRYDQSHKRLTSIYQCLGVNQSIDAELEQGIFDPRKYASRETSEQLRLGRFWTDIYFPIQQRRFENGDISPSTWKSKKGYFNNYLSDAFGSYDLRNITTQRLKLFYDTWNDKFRTRDLVLEELKYILNFSMEYGLIDKTPVFPKKKRVAHKNVENFLTDKEQQLVLNSIKNPQYRVMIEILSIYALRPGELRAIKWKDLNFQDGILSIQRHFSNGNKLVEGRKSRSSGEEKAILYLPITKKVELLLSMVPRNINPDSFVFVGHVGEFVSEKALCSAWKNALLKAEIKKKVSLYEGTRHSTLTNLKKKGFSDEELIKLSGHTNLETVKRYAKTRMIDQVEALREVLQ